MKIINKNLRRSALIIIGLLIELNNDDDSAGDACDPDIDSDGIMNHVDNCSTVFNLDQVDADRDGLGDEGCDDHFCYVVYGDEENCLDPEATFKVYSPSISLEMGETVNLRMFANRQDQPSRYTWSISSRPSGAKSTIVGATGRAMDSSLYQYILKNAPTFTPDKPGTYEIVLHAESLFSDKVSGEVNVTDQHRFQIVVLGGEADESGCSVSARGMQNGTLPSLAVLLLFGLRKRIKNKK